MKRLLILLLFALVNIPAMFSQEASAPREQDSIQDSVQDPAWYVAPIHLDSLVACYQTSRRAIAAADCPIDSICHFNVDSVLTNVTVYEYGDTTRTLTWTVNPDGSRFGNSKTESGTKGDITFSASYVWDYATNDWKGSSKEEHTYTGNKEMLRTLYAWVNGAWMPDTKMTWVYNESGRETELTTYTRNPATNELVYSKQRIREYNSAGKTTLDIQYTAHDGSNWSAGTKRIYDYDGKNTILNEYYSAYTNGEWIGSTKEIWTYTSGKKTYYEKQVWSDGVWTNSTKEIWEYNGPSKKQSYYEKDTWANGAWSGSSKELWEYTSSGKQTLHEKYGWSNGTWELSQQENSGFDANGNNILIENYTYTDGIAKGTRKEEYEYNSAQKKTLTIQYMWIASSGEWSYSTKSVNDYDAAGNTTETASYTWNNNAWAGNGTRTLTSYDSSKKATEVITQTWSSDASDWVNSTRNTMGYINGLPTHEASYEWQNEQWTGLTRTDRHFDANELNDTIWIYTPNGTEWEYSVRIAKNYDAEEREILSHTTAWNGSAWVLSSMTRTDIINDTEGRQRLYATWHCGSDSIWIGDTKDTIVYTPSGQNLYHFHYSSWENNDWVPGFKIEYEYDTEGNTLSEQRLNWVSGSWIGNYRYEYTYDTEGRRLSAATYNGWDMTYNNWIGVDKTESILDEGGRVLISTSYKWGNNDWTPYQRYLYTRDAQNRTIEQIIQSYTNNEWVNFKRNKMDYFNNTLSIDNRYLWINSNWVFTSRNESYYDDDASSKLRRRVLGTWNNGILLSFSDEQYFYACDIETFTVTFESYDGTQLASIEVIKGEVPVYTGEDPVKPSDAQFTYSFAGWTPEIVAATAVATYQAVFTATKNKYPVIFMNGEEILQSGEVEYGAMPAYEGATPEKEGDAQYSYTFAGWDNELAIVTGEATYNATFSSTVNKYPVTFMNGEEILQSGEVEYGAMPVFEGATPEKESDAQYSYTFAGWDNELAAVTGEVTYNATFSSTVNKYPVIFMNGEEILQSGEVEYGAMPAYEGATPEKESDAQYSYTFAGWDNELAAVTGEVTYNATFSSTVNKYPVIFMNGEEILQSGEVEYGAMPAYEGATPEKESDAQYSYTFAGWDNELAAVTGEVTYNAIFSSTVNTYTITFYYEDGETVMATQVLAYGEMPGTNITPAKTSDGHYYYHFVGWSPELEPVTGDASYTPVFTAEPKQYTITFKNYNGWTLQTTSVTYGEMPVYTGATPEKQRDQQYTYVFTGWSPELSVAEEDVTYTAVFEAVLNQYTIVFVNEDGTELDRQVLEYGTMPEYEGETPTKEPDEQFVYTFEGWSPQITTVSRDATYRATYSKRDKHEGLQDVQGDNVQSTKVMIDGTVYILRGGKLYTLDGTLVE